MRVNFFSVPKFWILLHILNLFAREYFKFFVLFIGSVLFKGLFSIASGAKHMASGAKLL